VPSVASALAALEEVTALVAKPHPDVDLATFVLASVDALLAAQAEIRRGLSPGRMIRPAERWHLAAGSMAAARRYADDLAAALRAAGGDRDPAGDGDLCSGGAAAARRARRPTGAHRRTRMSLIGSGGTLCR
jgi:hypothetical protein